MKKQIHSINDLEDKTQYLASALTKISHKGLELYCITRIWHLLNDLDIEPVFQQHVALPNGQRALIDLYFPQIKLAVEINEPYHKKQEDKDKTRNRNIVTITKSQIIKIDCSKGLQDIHLKINALVNKIRKKILKKKKAKDFQPWTNKTVDFFRTKGSFSRLDNDFLHNTFDFHKILGIKNKKRGFLPEGYGKNTTKDGLYPWFPKTRITKQGNEWINEISDDEKFIYESNENKNKNSKHTDEIIAENHTRIVFLETKDFLGRKAYYFKGVYKLNIPETKKKRKCVWEKISDEYKFQNRKGV